LDGRIEGEPSPSEPSAGRQCESRRGPQRAAKGVPPTRCDVRAHQKKRARPFLDSDSVHDHVHAFQMLLRST
jgi:hypothetical protein